MHGIKIVQVLECFPIRKGLYAPRPTRSVPCEPWANVVAPLVTFRKPFVHHFNPIFSKIGLKNTCDTFQCVHCDIFSFFARDAKSDAYASCAGWHKYNIFSRTHRPSCSCSCLMKLHHGKYRAYWTNWLTCKRMAVCRSLAGLKYNYIYYPIIITHQILLPGISDSMLVDKCISPQLSYKTTSWKPSGMLNKRIILFFPIAQSTITVKTADIILLACNRWCYPCILCLDYLDWSLMVEGSLKTFYNSIYRDIIYRNNMNAVLTFPVHFL